MAIVMRLYGDPCGPPFRREPQQYSTGASLAVKLAVRLQAAGFRMEAALHDLRQETRGNFGFWYLKPEACSLKPQLSSF
jgi:hypothetical protein